MTDVIIVGAGTAGLSAAIYILRAGKSVLLLEENSYGGQIITTSRIENYPGIREISGYEFATNLYKQAESLGAKVLFERCLGIEKKEENGQSIRKEQAIFRQEESGFFIVKTTENNYCCQSVILATGVKKRPLGLKREQEWVGRGVSYCAVCDGAFFRGKDVAVAGGGNTALEDAMFLSDYCRYVALIHRRQEFRGEERKVQLLRERKNVTFYLEQEVTALLGKDVLEKIQIRRKSDGKITELAVSGLFIAVGQMPDNGDFASLVKLDSQGYVLAGENCRTNVPGIFVAGDCRTKTVRQLTTAAADGAVAGLAACEYVSGK